MLRPSLSTRRARVALALVGGVGGAAAAACRGESVAPSADAPYLAVVVLADAAKDVPIPGPYTFRVRELSGTISFDTTFRASIRDTIILSVEPATYVVDISDVPPVCNVRHGTVQYVAVPPNSNTSLARFQLTCRPSLLVSTGTDGVDADTTYILGVRGADGVERTSVLGGNDTLRIADLVPGPHVLTLRHVAPHCVVTSDGGSRLTIDVSAAGDASWDFRVVCSDEARRPRVASLAGSYTNGSIAYVVHAVDPDKDVERTFVDVTSCDARSVLPGGGRLRPGFSGSPNVTGQATAVIIGGYDLGLDDAALDGRCLAAWVADERGNTSERVEVPLRRRSGTESPTALTFNAARLGTQSLSTSVTVQNADDDFAGVFVVYLLRDGVVARPADGRPDRLVFQPPGIIGSAIPDVPFGIGLGAWNDYLAVIVYLVDRAGNATRLEDTDLSK